MVGEMKSRVLFAALTMFVLTSVATDVHASVLAYWRFEEGIANSPAGGAGSVSDSAGSFHGTPTGGPIYRSDVGANPVPLTGATNNRSLEFDGSGTGDFVLAPDPTGVLNPTTAFTVEFWMRAGAQSGSLDTLLDHSHGFIDQTGWAFQTQPTGTMRFAVGDGGPFHEAISPVGSVRDNMWHHIAGVFDSTATGQELRLYIDGVLAAFDDNGGALALGNNRDIEIGRASSAMFPRYYSGFIDEIRISDTALAPSQFLNSAVPEPSSFVLLGMFGAGLLLINRQRKQNRIAG